MRSAASLAASFSAGLSLAALVTVVGPAPAAYAQAVGTVEVSPPAGYAEVQAQAQAPVVVAPPAPPPGYVVQQPVVVVQQPAYYVQPGPPPPADTHRGTRILAEIGGYFVGALVTGLMMAATFPAPSSSDDPSLFIASALVGVFVLCPLGTWLGGNLAGGNGGLGWTILGNLLLGIFGAVGAYELSHDPSLGRGQQPGAHYVSARGAPGGLSVPLGGVALAF
jgi:hypothetical protein